jgi:hypothetical protein
LNFIQAKLVINSVHGPVPNIDVLFLFLFFIY